MSLSLIIGPLSQDEIGRAIGALVNAGINVFGGSAVASPVVPPTATAPVMPAAPAVPAMPAMAAAAPAAPVMPAAPVAAAPANPKLEQALAAMGTYSQTHGVPVARQVLAMCQLQRVQDANDQQLDWLIGAFSNLAWKP